MIHGTATKQCYSAATVLLQCCYSAATVLLQCCYSAATVISYGNQTRRHLYVASRANRPIRLLDEPTVRGVDQPDFRGYHDIVSAVNSHHLCP